VVSAWARDIRHFVIELRRRRRVGFRKSIRASAAAIKPGRPPEEFVFSGATNALSRAAVEYGCRRIVAVHPDQAVVPTCRPYFADVPRSAVALLGVGFMGTRPVAAAINSGDRPKEFGFPGATNGTAAPVSNIDAGEASSERFYHAISSDVDRRHAGDAA